jgi:hypothetical protein
MNDKVTVTPTSAEGTLYFAGYIALAIDNIPEPINQGGIPRLKDRWLSCPYTLRGHIRGTEQSNPHDRVFLEESQEL